MTLLGPGLRSLCNYFLRYARLSTAVITLAQDAILYSHSSCTIIIFFVFVVVVVVVSRLAPRSIGVGTASRRRRRRRRLLSLLPSSCGVGLFYQGTDPDIL